MPDVGKYDARDQRAAETVETVRRWKIAEQIEGLGRTDHERAIWLFCRKTGYRKVTDLAWFSKSMAREESLEEFRQRHWCEGCRRAGCLSLIPAPSRLIDLPLDRRRADVRALFVDDRYL
jgi:hypothetical protein